MNFQSLPITAHPWLHLRALRAQDLAPWSAYLNRIEVYQHTSWNHPTPQDLASYLGNERDQEPSALLRLAIATRERDELVGTIGFHTVSAPNRSAEIAYDLHPSIWGQGVASALAAELVSWAHDAVGLVRVQATVLHSNAASIRVLERLGFVREGLLGSYRMVRGTPGDFFMYSHIARTQVAA